MVPAQGSMYARVARRAIISALIVAPSCAVYKQTDVEADHLISSAGDDQGNGGHTGGAMQGGTSGAADAGRSGAVDGGGRASGGGPGGTSAGGASAGSGGRAGNGAEGGAAGRGGTTAIGMSGATGMGGAAVAGGAGAKGGTGGATGAGGAAGTSGAGMSGAGGGSVVQQLAIGKNTTCSTEQTGHEARLANDADVTTRWCATSGSFPQWWRVDLGAVHTLRRIEIRVEHPDRTYFYTIETSLDDAAYTVRANVSGTGTIQASDFAPNVTARYLKVTVTGANPLVVSGNGTWASFYDVALTGI